MKYVLDTHSFVWFYEGESCFSDKIIEIFNKVENEQDSLIIPCIVFFELVYLVEKNKVQIDFDEILNVISLSKKYSIEPIYISVIEKAREIPRASIKDPWDRMIAATALLLKAPLISRDANITKVASKIDLEVIW